MTGTGDGEEGPEREAEDLPSSDDQLYFRAIEDAFIALRGAPLLLSPADWRAAQEWHRLGIPLDLIRRVLGEVFEKRRLRGTRGRVNSLRYCAPAVKAAWEELQELQGPGAPPGEEAPGLEERLEALARALPATLPRRDEWVEQVLALKGNPQAVEAALAELDQEMLAAAGAALTAAEARVLDQEVEEAIGRLSRRLPATELDALRRQLRRQHLRRHAGLPLLTLFGSPPPDQSALLGR